MKTPELNAALKNAPENHIFKVTLDADSDLRHTETVATPNAVRGLFRKYPSLSKGRVVVQSIHVDGIYFGKQSIFNGLLS